MLNKIISDKKEELDEVKRRMPLNELKARIKDLPPARNFSRGLKANKIDSEFNIIAELKKASPSKGIIRPDFDLLKIAHIYEDNGAKAISVLTEKNYFLGDLSYLQLVRAEISLPLLRKDFIFQEYQIYESAVFGADAFLLIGAVLEVSQIVDYVGLAREVGQDVLYEVHSPDDIEKGWEADIDIWGVNNRDLVTFKTDLATTFRLIPEIPPGKVIVSESGINKHEEIVKYREAGVDAFLIGETLLREKDIKKSLRMLNGREKENTERKR